MSKEKDFTEEIRCRSCGNIVPMEIIARHNDLESHQDERTGFTWDEGWLYELARCPACRGVSMRRARWHEGVMDQSEIEYAILYPPATLAEAHRGLPDRVRKALEAAIKVRAIDANAYSVLLGRVLDVVCKDRQATGRTLADKLKDLASKKEIPERLVQVANGLRQLRNVGAHADLGELTEAEVPVLDNLTRAILEYVYTAPVLVHEAEECVRRLRAESGSEPLADPRS